MTLVELEAERKRAEQAASGAAAGASLAGMLSHYDPGGSSALVRPATESEKEAPCFVHHPDAGGKCERAAVVRVYGLSFCEIHGEEAASGALEELYHDAAAFFERFDNPHVPVPSPEVGRELTRVVMRLSRLCNEAEYVRESALLRAYPLIPGRVCGATLDYDYGSPYEGATPVDVQLDARYAVHRLARAAFEHRQHWLVEVLEYHREAASAQAAFALEIQGQKERQA